MGRPATPAAFPSLSDSDNWPASDYGRRSSSGLLGISIHESPRSNSRAAGEPGVVAGRRRTRRCHRLAKTRTNKKPPHRLGGGETGGTGVRKELPRRPVHASQEARGMRSVRRVRPPDGSDQVGPFSSPAMKRSGTRTMTCVHRLTPFRAPVPNRFSRRSPGRDTRAKRKPPRLVQGGLDTHALCWPRRLCPHWSSFGTARRRATAQPLWVRP